MEKTPIDDGTYEYRKIPKSGRKVICNGTGRIWLEKYTGEKGVLLGGDINSRTDVILLDDGESLFLYFDEYEIID